MEINNLIGVPTKKTKIMIDKALDIMSKTNDPAHNLGHIERLLKKTNRFIRESANNYKVDREIILLSICWHDVWKVQRRPTMVSFFYHQWYEGIGSMIMFQKQAKFVGIPQDIVDKVSYAIRKHSFFQILPTRSIEAKLLRDVDTLDRWNPARTKVILKNIDKTNIYILDLYLFFMRHIGFRFNFDWSKNEVDKIKPLFFKEMSEFKANFENRYKNEI